MAAECYQPPQENEDQPFSSVEVNEAPSSNEFAPAPDAFQNEPIQVSADNGNEGNEIQLQQMNDPQEEQP